MIPPLPTLTELYNGWTVEVAQEQDGTYLLRLRNAEGLVITCREAASIPEAKRVRYDLCRLGDARGGKGYSSFRLSGKGSPSA